MNTFEFFKQPNDTSSSNDEEDENNNAIVNSSYNKHKLNGSGAFKNSSSNSSSGNPIINRGGIAEANGDPNHQNKIDVMPN